MLEGLKEQALDSSFKNDSQNTRTGPVGEKPPTMGESEADELRNPCGGSRWIQGSRICHLHHHSHCFLTPIRQHWKAAAEKHSVYMAMFAASSRIPLHETLR